MKMEDLPMKRKEYATELQRRYQLLIKHDALLESTVVILGDALVSMLNIEGPAMNGAPEGLDVPYHFNKLREALKELEARFPELHAAAFK
jgi:hypothetical protein